MKIAIVGNRKGWERDYIVDKINKYDEKYINEFQYKNEMKIDIIAFPKNYKKLLYLAGRNCYGLESIEDNIDDEILNKFIYKLIKNKHYSVLEHINISIFIKNVSRSLTMQLTRHRLCNW